MFRTLGFNKYSTEHACVTFLNLKLVIVHSDSIGFLSRGIIEPKKYVTCGLQA